MTLQQVMAMATEYMLEQNFNTAKDINNGGCFAWCTEVIAYIECKIVARAYADGYHCFIEYRGKYYDSETTQGIRRWQNLPYFKRCRE